jgi:NitT/TauT family transport system substrate-binding protein
MSQQPRRSFLLSSALAAGACTRRVSASRRVRLVLAGTPATLAYLPHTVARELNFYRKEGLLVAVDAVPGGTKGAQALLGGSADVVVGFYDHSIRIAAQGQSVRSFVTLTRYPGNVIITSPQSSRRIRSIGDLRQATIGVPDLGSQAHLVLMYLLVQHGLTPLDVKPVAVGTQSAGVAALERGRLDALSNFEPAVTQVLKRHPNVRVLADARTQKGVRELFGVDAYPGSVLYAKADWLSENADTARRLARAIQASLRWIHQKSLDEIMSVVPIEHFGENRSIYREALTHSMDMYGESGQMPVGGPEAVRKVLASFLENVRDAKVDLSRTYTNAFVTGQ